VHKINNISWQSKLQKER